MIGILFGALSLFIFVWCQTRAKHVELSQIVSVFAFVVTLYFYGTVGAALAPKIGIIEGYFASGTLFAFMFYLNKMLADTTAPKATTGA